MTLLLSVVIFGVYSAALLAVAGVGFTLQFGVTNVLNLAFGSIFTASIFAEYGLTGHSADIWIAMAVGGAAGALFSLVIGHFVVTAFLRRGADRFGIAMVTIAISLMVQFGLEAIQGPYIWAYTSTAHSTLDLGGVVVSSEQFTTITVAVAAMIAVHLLLRTTKLGLAMRATAADVSLTRSCGVSPSRTRIVAWLVSGALCGLGGVLFGINEGSFSASRGSDIIITVAAAAVLGGIGQPYGAMIGSLVVGIVSQAAAALISPSYKTIAAWVILIAVLLLRPLGIMAEFAAVRELVA